MPHKIMIIDDEPDIRLYLSAAIEDNGFEPITLDTDTSAVNMIADTKPNLIVMDIMMPMRSGISIYKEIRSSESFREIPIILISGMAGASDFMETGFRELVADPRIPKPNGFLEKPVTPKKIVQAICNILEIKARTLAAATPPEEKNRIAEMIQNADPKALTQIKAL